VADVTIYLPDAVNERARELGIPLSRSAREVLMAVIRAIEGDPAGDPVAEIIAYMESAEDPF